MSSTAAAVVNEPKRKPRGGKRTGAGRKRSVENRLDPKHVRRPTLDPRHPVHVMLRTRDDVPKLRQRRIYEAMRVVLAGVLAAGTLRVVHISIQRNHLHLIVEAASEDSLSRGMQSFTIRAARAINGATREGRRGKVFRFRYQAKQIRTRDYARNAIAYVLNNWRRHRLDLGDPASQRAVLDEFSSADSFTGWMGNAQTRMRKRYAPLPVAPPRTSLLQAEWQWFGLIDPWEVPGRPA